MRRLWLAAALCLAPGCATLGPVVVEVTSDGAGALVAQRCSVHANFFAATMRFTSCTFEEVRVYPKPPHRTSWTFTPDGKTRPPDGD